jgi:hypothetical protein
VTCRPCGAPPGGDRAAAVGMKTVRAISALMQAMPAFDAGDDERATWLELKAEVFAQTAAEHRAVAAEADAYAMAVRGQAVALRAGQP